MHLARRFEKTNWHDVLHMDHTIRIVKAGRAIPMIGKGTQGCAPAAVSMPMAHTAKHDSGMYLLHAIRHDATVDTGHLLLEDSASSPAPRKLLYTFPTP